MVRSGISVEYSTYIPLWATLAQWHWNIDGIFQLVDPIGIFHLPRLLTSFYV